MKFLISLGFALILPQVLFAQKDIQLSIEYIEQLTFSEQESLLEQKLHSVLLYNQTLKDFGKDDFISTSLENGEYRFYYKDQILDDFFNPKKEHKSPIAIQGQYTAHSFLLSFYTILDDEHFYKFNLIRKDEGDFAIYCNYKNEMYDGAYIEKYLSGASHVNGNYTQIDSFHIDTIEVFDPETYEMKRIISEKEKVSIKCGTWTYKTNEGIREKVYQKCN